MSGNLKSIGCVGRDKAGKRCNESYKGLCNLGPSHPCRRSIETCLTNVFGKEARSLFGPLDTIVICSLKDRSRVKESFDLQEGAEKLKDIIGVVKKRKSLNRQSKVDALESEVRWLDPVLDRFWKPLPQISCPFVGGLQSLCSAKGPKRNFRSKKSIFAFCRLGWVMWSSCLR